MRNLYQKIEQCLDKVDFEKLWPKFKRNDFVLYSETRAYFKDKVVGKPREFYGNTSAKYQGNNIAIWYIDSPENETEIEVLSSKIVHEMFHAFQMDNKEERFAKEIDGVLYPYDEDNIQIRYEEIKKLLLLFDNFKKKDYKEFISLRLERQKLIGKYFDYEMKVEVIEGLANYVELNALKMISEEKYNEQILLIKNNLSDITYQLNIRQSLYYTGALLYTILERENISYDKKITNVSKTIFEMIKGRNKPTISFFTNNEVQEKLTIFLTQRGEEVLKNLRDLDAYSCNNIKLIGFDPLNTISYNGYIFARRFLVTYEDNTEKYLFGRFVFQIDENNMITKLYKREDYK